MDNYEQNLKRLTDAGVSTEKIFSQEGIGSKVSDTEFGILANRFNLPTMNTAQANQVLGQYGVDPNRVLSAGNIQNTLTKPATAPDDLLGIRANIGTELGLDAQQTAYQNAMAAARNKVNELNTFNANANNQTVSMNVIRGEQARARELAAPELERLQYQAQMEGDKLNALTAERNYRVGIAEKNIDFTRSLKLEYPGAGIGFGDTLDTVEKKLVSFKKDQEKKAEKDAVKNLYFQTFGTIGKDTKKMQKELKKAFQSKAAYDAAVNANALATSTTEQAIKNMDLALKKVQLQKAQDENKPISPDDIPSLYNDDTTVQTPTGGMSVAPTANPVVSFFDNLNKPKQ